MSPILVRPVREQLEHDRIIRLFGLGRVSLTTKTMEEVGQRISRYLGMFTLVNSTFGLIISSSCGVRLMFIPMGALSIDNHAFIFLQKITIIVKDGYF